MKKPAGHYILNVSFEGGQVECTCHWYNPPAPGATPDDILRIFAAHRKAVGAGLAHDGTVPTRSAGEPTSGTWR